MKRVINENQGSLLRTLLRVALVAVTAFGLKLTTDQVAATQMVGEAILQTLVRWNAAQ